MENQTTLPAQLEEQVKSSGLELTEAQSIAANYSPFFEVVAEKEAELKKLEKGNPAHVAIAKRIRIDLGRTASAIDAVKKQHKEMLLTRTRYIDGLFNAANGYARLTQETAKDIEDHFERMEAERKSKLREVRAAQLVQFEGLEPIAISEMSDAEWSNYLVGVEAGFNARIAAEAKAKADLEAAQEAERKRIQEQAEENARLKVEAEKAAKELAEANVAKAKAEAEANAKIEAARKQAEEEAAKERKEQEDLLAKQRYKDAQARKVTVLAFLQENGYRECNGGFEAISYHHFIGENHYSFFESDKEVEQFKISVIRQAELELEKANAVKLQAELQAKKDAEAKAEADRIAAEKQAEADRIKAAKAPIKTKLNLWVDSFELPQTDVDNPTTNVILEKFNAYKVWAKSQVENL